MPIRSALLLTAGGLAVAMLAGCGDSETNDAALTTTSSTAPATDDTATAGVDDGCVDTIVAYFNNELDLTRLADPSYVEEVTADLGACDPATVDPEQAAEISGRLDPDVVAAISGAPAEDPAATTTPTSTP